MKVKEAMNRDVKSIGPDKTILEAGQRMERYGLGCLLVIRDQKLMGILTEGDILRKVTLQSLNAKDVLVKDVMISPAVTIGPDDTVLEAADLMNKKRIKKLPVIDHTDIVVGIITATDIVARSRNLTDRILTLLIYQPEQTVSL
jgi:CBS domain-containing protein